MIKGKKKGLFPKQRESKSYQLHHSPFIIGISPKLRERISNWKTLYYESKKWLQNCFVTI